MTTTHHESPNPSAESPAHPPVKDEDVTFYAVDEEGNALFCTLLASFEAGGRNFILYTDDATDDDGDTQVYASIADTRGLSMVDDEHCKLALTAITDDEDWGLVEHVLDTLQENGTL